MVLSANNLRTDPVYRQLWGTRYNCSGPRVWPSKGPVTSARPGPKRQTEIRWTSPYSGNRFCHSMQQMLLRSTVHNQKPLFTSSLPLQSRLVLSDGWASRPARPRPFGLRRRSLLPYILSSCPSLYHSCFVHRCRQLLLFAATFLLSFIAQLAWLLTFFIVV